MYELDLPCSDCGTDLVERSVHVHDLPVSTTWQGTVQVAECPACGARFYPKRALSHLCGMGNSPRSRGDS